MLRRTSTLLPVRCRRWIEAVYAFDGRLHERQQASPAFVLVVSAMIEVCVLVISAAISRSARGGVRPALVFASCSTGLVVALVRYRLSEQRAEQTARRHSAGLCPNCGYDLRATPGRCPECGAGPHVDLGSEGARGGRMP